MKKSLEIRNKIDELKNKAQSLIDNNEVQSAQNVINEIKDLKNELEVQELEVLSAKRDLELE